jgi:hypothetical protein
MLPGEPRHDARVADLVPASVDGRTDEASWRTVHPEIACDERERCDRRRFELRGRREEACARVSADDSSGDEARGNASAPQGTPI